MFRTLFPHYLWHWTLGQENLADLAPEELEMFTLFVQLALEEPHNAHAT